MEEIKHELGTLLFSKIEFEMLTSLLTQFTLQTRKGVIHHVILDFSRIVTDSNSISITRDKDNFKSNAVRLIIKSVLFGADGDKVSL